ncbi:MAG: hypothetical protein Tsb0020_06950 [Haliangiales bacterium]
MTITPEITSRWRRLRLRLGAAVWRCSVGSVEPTVGGLRRVSSGGGGLDASPDTVASPLLGVWEIGRDSARELQQAAI